MPMRPGYYQKTFWGAKDFYKSLEVPEDWRSLSEFKIGKKICRVVKTKGNPIERAKQAHDSGFGLASTPEYIPPEDHSDYPRPDKRWF